MINIFVYLLPFLISASLLLTYFISPDFYLTYVLNGLNREAQAVENITFFSALFASLILFKNSYSLSKSGKENRVSVAYIFIIGLAIFFMAGEEASWGQSYFQWKTPEAYDTLAVETNLHNTKLPLHALGNLFIFIMFIFLPIAFRNNLKIFSGINLKIWVLPNNGVIFFILYAVLWRSFKSTFQYLYTRDILATIPFYMNFLEQINEQKEMLLAVAFFVYALYIDSAVKKASCELKSKNA